MIHDLFNQPPMPGPRDTSRMAYKQHKQEGKAAIQADAILDLLKEAGHGMTRNEIGRDLKIPLSSVCGRVNELMKAGSVTDEPRRKCSVTGRNSHEVKAV